MNPDIWTPRVRDQVRAVWRAVADNVRDGNLPDNLRRAAEWMQQQGLGGGPASTPPVPDEWSGRLPADQPDAAARALRFFAGYGNPWASAETYFPFAWPDEDRPIGELAKVRAAFMPGDPPASAELAPWTQLRATGWSDFEAEFRSLSGFLPGWSPGGRYVFEFSLLPLDRHASQLASPTEGARALPTDQAGGPQFRGPSFGLAAVLAAVAATHGIRLPPLVATGVLKAGQGNPCPVGLLVKKVAAAARDRLDIQADCLSGRRPDLDLPFYHPSQHWTNGCSVPVDRQSVKWQSGQSLQSQQPTGEMDRVSLGEAPKWAEILAPGSGGGRQFYTDGFDDWRKWVLAQGASPVLLCGESWEQFIHEWDERRQVQPREAPPRPALLAPGRYTDNPQLVAAGAVLVLTRLAHESGCPSGCPVALPVYLPNLPDDGPRDDVDLTSGIVRTAAAELGNPLPGLEGVVRDVVRDRRKLILVAYSETAPALPRFRGGAGTVSEEGRWNKLISYLSGRTVSNRPDRPAVRVVVVPSSAEHRELLSTLPGLGGR